MHYSTSNTCSKEDSVSSSEPEFVNLKGAQESIPATYVAWRAGTSKRVVVPARKAGNQFLGSLKLKRFTNLGSALQTVRSTAELSAKMLFTYS